MRFRRVEQVHVRLSLAEKAALHRLIRTEQTCQSEVLRVALRAYARQRGVWPAVTDEQAEEITK